MPVISIKRKNSALCKANERRNTRVFRVSLTTQKVEGFSFYYPINILNHINAKAPAVSHLAGAFDLANYLP